MADTLVTMMSPVSYTHLDVYKRQLFDRDTLLVFHYDVNFLYVVSLYARHNEHQKFAWKNRVRKMFRDEIQHYFVYIS